MEKYTDTRPSYKVVVGTEPLQVEIFGVGGRPVFKRNFTSPVDYIDVWNALNGDLKAVDKAHISGIIATIMEAFQELGVSGA